MSILCLHLVKDVLSSSVAIGAVLEELMSPAQFMGPFAESSFLDAIASLQIPYIQVTYLLSQSQSASHLLGWDYRPFRQV